MANEKWKIEKTSPMPALQPDSHLRLVADTDPLRRGDAAIANCQYAWTLFTTDITGACTRVLTSAVTLTFSSLRRRHYFRLMLTCTSSASAGSTLASLFVALGWIGAGRANSLPPLCSLCDGRHRRRLLQFLRRRRDEVVSRSTRTLRRRGRRLLRLRYGADHSADLLSDRTPVIVSVHNLRGDSSVCRLIAAQFLRMPPAGWLPAGWKRSKRKSKGESSSQPAIARPAKCCAADRFTCLLDDDLVTRAVDVDGAVEPIGVTYGYDKYALFGGFKY